MRATPHQPKVRSLGTPLRTYIIIAAVAAIPLAAFLVLGHRLLNQQATSRLLAQSSQSGRLYGSVIEQHFSETSIYLRSFAERREVLADWQAHRYASIASDLKQFHALRSDFLSFAIFDLDGNL